MVDFNKKEKYDIDDLLEIMRLLRAPGGCPWDAEQTHMSIKKDLIEETYEVIEAINKDDKELMTEELGDLLFSVVNVSRFINVDAEEALTASTDKFLNRFAIVERLAKERNIDMSTSSIEELDSLWDEAKNITKSN